MSYDFSDLYPSERLCAADLPEEGITLTIETIGKTVMRDGKQVAILTFRGVDKEAIWNKTKGNLLRQLYGPPSNWIGKKVMLKPGQTYFGKDLVDCINAFPPRGMAVAGAEQAAPPARRVPRRGSEPAGEPEQRDPGDLDDLDDAIPF